MARKNAIKIFDSALSVDTHKVGSVSTSNGTIFSYAMPIAQMRFNHCIDIVNNDESPSPTTSTLINGILELATSHDFTITRVSEIKRNS